MGEQVKGKWDKGEWGKGKRGKGEWYVISFPSMLLLFPKSPKNIVKLRIICRKSGYTACYVNFDHC